ncbi:glycosyltransferase family 4 protein [Amphiplicatus metriothermophilus]|uniref:UDP-GlcNAc:undecaprenyl-phosphate GlcNAc-1-phosphate transferase n=1 Tax=Amphiplicatus metriothermophilus TaxID=1519374 RepID=A0A239PJZ7_9PROT|nr:hypothetical protein [Amphiplicatus metriothermophilus]MBB5518013.1 UDP-N-acetylmuramyl pentapeptide phosphotransferase/UDP-N-acetylglucosamine-1-phosphate transferase [Amphiplicatus metriothermophilus]SNT67653.1 UDP-GlcNAc:undecaprenyl-phosphate GlcNAc-1-phosphate transferase [Amphiplicatus metriothermophilus]
MPAEPIVLGVIGVCVAAVGAALSRLAVRRRLVLDHPNGRSNHRDATPRSGGLAIAGAWTIGMVLAALAVPSFALVALKLAAIAALVFTMGLADDLYDLSPVWKFAGQLAAAALFIVLFGALETGPVPFAGAVPLGAAGVFLTVLWIVGFMNAFNFMDGVNGMAAGCGLLTAAGLAGAAAFSGAPETALAAGLLGAALLGFLPSNFPRGRLFMGDCGSQTVGFLIAALAVVAAQESAGAASALFVPTAMAAFLFDVAFTLIHRARRRRNVLAAHCEHLYQLMARLGASHVQTTAVYASLTAASLAAAFVMTRLDPGAQWLVPAGLALVFCGLGWPLFARARRAGLLARAETPAPSAGAGEDAAASRQIPQAAE